MILKIRKGDLMGSYNPAVGGEVVYGWCVGVRQRFVSSFCPLCAIIGQDSRTQLLRKLGVIYI